MNDSGERARSAIRSAVALVVVLCCARRGAAETGDFLCDSLLSGPDTCVVSDRTIDLADGTVLRFTAPNARIAGALVIHFPGRCSLDATASCAADADCTPPGLCVRTGEVAFVVDGTFAVDPHAELVASGQAVAGDTIGPDGGTITVTAHDVSIAGTISVTAGGTNGIAAGHAGAIAVTADGAVTIPAAGNLDASTSGGCGGSIVITGPATLDSAGPLDVGGATRGGAIRLAARDLVSVGSALAASNTNSDPRTRPACGDGKGGGEIRLEGSRVVFTGSATARGREAAGGAVLFRGEREVTVASTLGRAPIMVTGGDAAAFTPGGLVSLVATAGDVTVRGNAIEANGVSTGVGSDAGAFIITASGTSRCSSSGALCTDRTACAPGDPCIEAGGRVDVEVPISAVGGDGLGSGCVACEIRGTGGVTVSGAVNVSGARQLGAVGGKVTIAGGGDVTVGPGPVTANAGDGGSIIVVAGERVGAARDIGGELRIVNGTELLALARQDGGFGGDIGVEGCDVVVEPSVHLTVDGGQHGQPGTIDLIAHERLEIGGLAALSALPNGPITLSYGVGATIAPDALFVPAPSLAQDSTLPPCPACGNGMTEALEECDGRGTCALAGEICIPAGSPGECSCIDTCGTVPGIQPGEECDGDDLGGATCGSRGFSGGVLACAADCSFDTRRCFSDVCGDGVVGPTEDCDRGGDGIPPSFGGKTCETLGFPGGGNLVCKQDCTIDTSACVNHLCGNGVVEPTEACDPGGIGGASPAFGANTCKSLHFPAGGTLTCTQDCAEIITVPHCATTVTRRCTANGDCPGAETCVAGCRQCGNGFVDGPDEQCDEGPDNGSQPDHCRSDCRLPRCGDGTVDRGEECDRGDALCRGGPNDGGRCCTAADCPGGQCAGAGCTSNRDDLAGCCGCDCRLVPVACGSCDDQNPCTADACDPRAGCTHTALADGAPCGDGDICNGDGTCRGGRCMPGSALDCDDGDVCTIDTCHPATGCTHEPLGYADASRAIQASLFIQACVGEKVPGRIGRLLNQARILIERADGTRRAKVARLLVRADRKLRQAIGRARRAGKRGLAQECAGPLAEIIGDALARARCLVP